EGMLLKLMPGDSVHPDRAIISAASARTGRRHLAIPPKRGEPVDAHAVATGVSNTAPVSRTSFLAKSSLLCNIVITCRFRVPAHCFTEVYIAMSKNVFCILLLPPLAALSLHASAQQITSLQPSLSKNNTSGIGANTRSAGTSTNPLAPAKAGTVHLHGPAAQSTFHPIGSTPHAVHIHHATDSSSSLAPDPYGYAGWNSNWNNGQVYNSSISPLGASPWSSR
ncbi:MAG TPA: hypothetical protein VEI25_10285, partial [Paraburkholderia sp.]|nr:hypothetical protein [Paraburkholderia sp.]